MFPPKIHTPTFTPAGNCVRQEKGYCRVQWSENSVTSPDPFQLDTGNNPATPTLSTTAAGGAPTPAITVSCPLAYVTIPEGQCSPLSLVELQRGLALIGRELHDNASVSSLMFACSSLVL